MWFDDEQDETMGGQAPQQGFGPGFAGMGQQGAQQQQPPAGAGLSPGLKAMLMAQVVGGGDPFKAMAAMAQLKSLQQEQAMGAEMQGTGGPQGAPGGMPPGGPGGAPEGQPGGPEQAPQDPRIAMLQKRADIALRYNRPDVANKYLQMAQSLAKPVDEWGAPVTERDPASGQPVVVRYSKGGQRQVVQGAAPQDEVHSVVEVRGPDGQPMKVTVGKDGRPIGQGMPGYVKPELVDLGGSKGFVTPQAGQSFDVTMTPGQVDESKRGWANVGINQGQLAVSQGNLGLSRQRLTLDQQQAKANTTPEGVKLPAGWRWNPLTNAAEPVAGTKEAVERRDDGIAKDRKEVGAVDQADRIIGTLDNTMKLVGHSTAGLGSVLANVPGTKAKDVQAALAMVKANLGFAELQAMREASPTGGALGQVAVQELMALQSTVAALDQAQSPAALKAAMGQVNKHYRNWRATVIQARGERGGGPLPARQRAPQQGGATGDWGPGQQRAVKRTGKTADGRTVVEYTDGTREFR